MSEHNGVYLNSTSPLTPSQAEHVSLVALVCSALSCALCGVALIVLSCTCARSVDDDPAGGSGGGVEGHAERRRKHNASRLQHSHRSSMAASIHHDHAYDHREHRHRRPRPGSSLSFGSTTDLAPGLSSLRGLAIPSHPTSEELRVLAQDAADGGLAEEAGDLGDDSSQTAPLLGSSSGHGQPPQPWVLRNGHTADPACDSPRKRGRWRMQWRRAPPVLKWKVATDLLLVANTLWISAYVLIVGPQHVSGYNSSVCHAYAVVHEVASHASSLWFLLLSVDLWLAARDPFANSTGSMWWYHLTVWSVTGLILLTLNVLGATEEGMSSYCWFDDIDKEAPSELSLFMRQFPLSHSIALLASIIILVLIVGAVGSLDTNASLGLCARRSILVRGVAYAIIFGTLATCKLAIGVVLLLHPPSQASVRVVMRYADADASYLAVIGVANVLAAVLTVRWARHLHNRAIKMLTVTDKVPLLAERESSSNSSSSSSNDNTDHDDNDNDDDDNDDDDEGRSASGSKEDLLPHLGRMDGSLHNSMVALAAPLAGSAITGDDAHLLRLIGSPPPSLHAHGDLPSFFAAASGPASTQSTPGGVCTPHAVQRQGSHGAVRRGSSPLHPACPDAEHGGDGEGGDGSTMSWGARTGNEQRSGIHSSSGKGNNSGQRSGHSRRDGRDVSGRRSAQSARLHRQGSPVWLSQGRARSDTIGTTASLVSLESDTALVGRQSHLRAQQLSSETCRAVGRRVELMDDDDTHAAAMRAMRDDVMLCTLFGIVSTLNSTRTNPPPQLRQTVTLPPVFNREIEFIDYHQDIFARLRSLFGISAREYAASIWGDQMRQEIQKMTEGFSSGRSGSFLYLTHDKQYVVKTIDKKECALLRELLPAYLTHMRNNPTSLLVRFCGLHAVRLTKEQRYITFVVQQHIVNTARYSARVHRMYDLKGSQYNRSAVNPPQGCGAALLNSKREHKRGQHSPRHEQHEHRHSGKRGVSRASAGTRHFKDLDLMSHGVIAVGRKARSSLSTRLAADVAFLHEQGIIDFSLLVGVHFRRPTTVMPPPLESSSSSGGGGSRRTRRRVKGKGKGPATILDGVSAVFMQRECIVYFGIIDILQRYDRKKRLEHFAKTKLMGVDPTTLSCVDVDLYCERFYSRVLQHFV
ncbi:hypothetical protein PTSG_02412 [Salpingoeca rosetta]|uniref:PIPK domain-containing protein n=1 Tax=Salpingoeca rosetta (strain ATCC 50818 / BSB-021) TaxID=946362 RepID=F2U247_SALR5|nr:uncharacterized protein PTSG_02412 [Salpingoeca rosetta]EGD81699.1 hypothetical protein PTSG_02412 [Salpingoeca rosetta]|eukprot:XP_004996903.1 hypothetical protein PTSG_02412 [Salpingoeca rosetta]